MHYAGKIAESFLEAYQKSEKKRFHDKKFSRSVRAAALLHDIGHPALSHNVERIFTSAFMEAKSKTLLAGDGSPANSLLDHPVAQLVKQESKTEKNPFENSVMSWFLIQHSSLTTTINAGGLDPADVAKIVIGRRSPVGPNRSAHDQILNGGMDADKLDYLQRDSRATGVRYGNFDVEWILHNIANDRGSICVSEDAVQACVHLMFVRFLWYSQIIYNKHFVAFQEMVKRAYPAVVKNSSSLPGPSETLDLLWKIKSGDQDAEDQWSSFVDSKVFDEMETVRRAIRAGKKIDESVMKAETLEDFLDRILRRRLPLPLIARVDGVQVDHRRIAGTGPTKEEVHPRREEFKDFVKWIESNHDDDLRMGRIIVSEEFVPLLKEEEDTPILVRTGHDATSFPLKDHYSCIFKPIYEHQSIQIALRRIYSVGAMESELKGKWESILAKGRKPDR